MQIDLYKHIQSKNFDMPRHIVLFTSQQNYIKNYLLHISNCKYWTGEGTTKLIGLVLICDIPISVYKLATPTYMHTYLEETDEHKFYYVTNADIYAGYARLTLSLDVFATYYEKTIYDNQTSPSQQKPFIITRSTLKLDADRYIIIPDEVTPIKTFTSRAVWTITQSNSPLVFLIKVKYLQAKSLTTEAYTMRLFAMEIPIEPLNARTSLFSAYRIIQNMYEIVADAGLFPGTGLDIDVIEAYIIPKEAIAGYTYTANIRYINVDATPKLQQVHLFNFHTAYNFSITNYASDSKLKIGENEFLIPNYYGTIPIIINFINNETDFDILLKVGANTPQSIKNIFKVEISNTTQQTSLQQLANGIKGIVTGIASVATTFATGGGTAAAVVATGQLQNEAQQIITNATRSQLPATNFENTAFNIYLYESGALRYDLVRALIYTGTDTQGAATMENLGIEWYNKYAHLEDLNSLFPIIGNKRYIECNVEVGGIPAQYARDIEELLQNGVYITNG